MTPIFAGPAGVSLVCACGAEGKVCATALRPSPKASAAVSASKLFIEMDDSFTVLEARLRLRANLGLSVQF